MIRAITGRYMPDRIISAANNTTYYGSITAFFSSMIAHFGGLDFAQSLALGSFILAFLSFIVGTAINVWYKLNLLKIARKKAGLIEDE